MPEFVLRRLYVHLRRESLEAREVEIGIPTCDPAGKWFGSLVFERATIASRQRASASGGDVLGCAVAVVAIASVAAKVVDTSRRISVSRCQANSTARRDEQPCAMKRPSLGGPIGGVDAGESCIRIRNWPAT